VRREEASKTEGKSWNGSPNESHKTWGEMHCQAEIKHGASKED